jgi:hypothetical protein
LTRKEVSVPDLGKGDISGKKKEVHPWFFEEEGGFCVLILRF